MQIDPTVHAELQHADIELFLVRPEHVTQQYVSWLNDAEVNRYLESRFAAHTIESTQAFVQANLAAPDAVLFGIRSRALDEHVGNIRLGHIHMQHRTAEIGILIGNRKAWGKGLASASISLVCEFARRQLQLRKVTAGCYAVNIGSLRAFEKAGFRSEAVRREQCLLQGEPADIVLLGCMLR